MRELSSETKHFRFMNSLQELDQQMLVRFTQIDYHNEMALIAVTPGDSGEEQIGVAHYATNLDKKSCEFALVVSDRWQSKGIAHHLMQNLVEIARDRGLETMQGQVLRNNSTNPSFSGDLSSLRPTGVEPLTPAFGKLRRDAIGH